MVKNPTLDTTICPSSISGSEINIINQRVAAILDVFLNAEFSLRWIH